MKLIAGSVLAGFGLLVTALEHLQLISTDFAGTGYYFTLDSPIEILAILFIVGGIGLISWAFWEITKKEKE